MLLVITGPSGAGKTTLIRAFLERHPEMKFSVSHTTRPPRPGEVDGLDYHFVSEAEFSRLIKKKAFVEWAIVHGYYYGTSKKEFKKSQSVDLVLDIDVQGARQVKELALKEAVFIFILPPNRESLEKRLLARGDLAAEERQRRLQRAKQEIKNYHLFDYVIINEKVDQALEEIEAIVKAENRRQLRMRKKILAVLASFKAKSQGR